MENSQVFYQPRNGSDKSSCSNLRVIGIWIFKNTRMNEIMCEENTVREKSLKEHSPRHLNV